MSRRWRPIEPLSVREAIQAKASEIRAALSVHETPTEWQLQRDAAREVLRSIFPDGGKLLVVRRGSRKGKRAIVDCKRLDAHCVIPMGQIVADALSRPYLYESDGFAVGAEELPSLFTGILSLALYGQRGKIQVEML